jgi:Tol biopolymer transport system component
VRAAAAALALAAALLLAGSAHSSNAQVIVFAADRAPAVSGDVFRVDANGRVANLTHSPWQDTEPAVSPNGKLIAFLSDRDGGSLWAVGVDGRGLQRIPAIGLPSEQSPSIAWSPNGAMIALVAGTAKRETLSLAGFRATPRVLARGSAFGAPSWSPDGTLVTVPMSGEVDAYTLSGKRAWWVPSGAFAAIWSAKGLLATGALDGRIHVVDEHGITRFSVPADSGSWSPDGRYFASVRDRRLYVVTSTGARVFRATLPGAYAGLEWVSSTRIASGSVAYDVTTGRSAPFDAASFGINTVKSGSTFAVRVGTRVYTHVIGCDDDGGPGAAIAFQQMVPHSRSIVYQSYCAEPFDNLYSINPDGTGLRRITNVQANQVKPAVSPDGARIAFGESPYTGLSCKGCPESLRTIGIDGGHATTLTSPPDCTFDDSPSWSPDGTQIMFVHSACDTAPSAMLVAASGGATTDLHVPTWTLAWGPTRIAYANGTTIPSSMWTAAPDGTSRVRVAAIGAGLTTPAWSPDGRLSYLLGTTVVVQGGTKVQLPFSQVRSIAWSPDGTRFLVAAKPKGAPTFDLYTVKTDGTDVVRLTSNMDVASGDWS